MKGFCWYSWSVTQYYHHNHKFKNRVNVKINTLNRSISISCLLKFERKILVHSKTYEFAEFFSPENWIKLSQYIRFLKFLSRKFRNVVCFCGHPVWIFSSLHFMWFCTVWFSCELELPNNISIFSDKENISRKEYFWYQNCQYTLQFMSDVLVCP